MRKLINVNEITEYSYFNPKHNLFPKLNLVVFVPKPNRTVTISQC